MSLTGPQGTPAALSAPASSARSRRAMRAPSSRASSARCSTRAALVAKRLSARELGGAELAAERLELAVVADGDDDLPVGRREGLVRRDARVAVPHPPGQMARPQEARRLVGERGQERAEQRDLGALAEAAALALRERGEDRDGGEQPGDDVDERDADLRRRPVLGSR